MTRNILMLLALILLVAFDRLGLDAKWLIYTVVLLLVFTLGTFAQSTRTDED